MTEAQPVIDDVRELLALTDLSDIVFYQVAAQRKDEADQAAEPEESHGGEELPVQVFARHDATHIEVRVRAAADGPSALYVVDVGARFTLQRPVEVSPSAMKEFVERVGVMAAFPYVREGVHDLASKLRAPAPLLGLLRAGAVQLESAQEQTEVSAETTTAE